KDAYIMDLGNTVQGQLCDRNSINSVQQESCTFIRRLQRTYQLKDYGKNDLLMLFTKDLCYELKEIRHVKNIIDNYKSVGTVIGLKIQKNDSNLNTNLFQVNVEEFSYSLRLEHKRLVNKAKEYENFKVVKNHDKTKGL
ncbi:11821_t:CDS:2, partial [Gigaspora margarita]